MIPTGGGPGTRGRSRPRPRHAAGHAPTATGWKSGSSSPSCWLRYSSTSRCGSTPTSSA